MDSALVSFASHEALPVLWQGGHQVLHVPEVQSAIPPSALLVRRRLVLLSELIHGASDLVGGVCKVLVPQGHPHVICLSQQVLLLLGLACRCTASIFWLTVLLVAHLFD